MTLETWRLSIRTLATNARHRPRLRQVDREQRLGRTNRIGDRHHLDPVRRLLWVGYVMPDHGWHTDDDDRDTIHDAIQRIIGKDELVTRWTLVVETTDGTEESLSAFSGGGHDGSADPSMWMKLGMLMTATRIVEQQILDDYEGSEITDDPDPDAY